MEAFDIKQIETEELPATSSVLLAGAHHLGIFVSHFSIFISYFLNTDFLGEVFLFSFFKVTTANKISLLLSKRDLKPKIQEPPWKKERKLQNVHLNFLECLVRIVTRSSLIIGSVLITIIIILVCVENLNPNMTTVYSRILI